MKQFTLPKCDLFPDKKRNRFLSSIIFQVGIPPSPLRTALGVVFIAGSAYLRFIKMALSIMLHRPAVGDVTIPLTVGRLRPGH